jgi:flagellar assembly protein FliH
MSEAGRLRALAAASAAERWSLPAVEGPIVGQRRDSGGVENDGGERASQAGRDRGFEAGMAAGRAEIQRLTGEIKVHVRRLDSVLAALAKPLAELDAEAQQQLLLLALAIGKQLARREIKANPDEIIALIRESIGRLPASAREVRIHLHPQDAALVREHLAAPADERAWTLVEDPTQARGGCLLRTESSQIDQRLETRVNAIVGSLMGDERAGARSGRSDGPLAEPAGSRDTGERGDEDADQRLGSSDGEDGAERIGQGAGEHPDPGAVAVPSNGTDT